MGSRVIGTLRTMSHLARTSPESLLVHGPRLRTLARALVGDAHLAEDLVQETWSRALESPPPEGRPLLRWLTAVLRNLAFQGKRMGVRRAAREREAAREDASEPAAVAFERFELHRELVETIRGLREPYRQAILLRYFDGLPPRRIAQRLGVPPKTVKTRLHRGLALRGA